MRDLIKLSCENCGRDNYVTDKNKRNMPEKFRIKKYCPKCRSHHSHKEGKMPDATATKVASKLQKGINAINANPEQFIDQRNGNKRSRN